MNKNQEEEPISQPTQATPPLPIQPQQPYDPELSSISSSESEDELPGITNVNKHMHLLQSPEPHSPQKVFTNEKTLQMQQMEMREDIDDFFDPDEDLTQEELDKLNQERKLKQNFLKSDVLLKGYEPKIFGDYISGLKENGGDIDEWTMDQLVKIVEDFKKEHPKPKKIDYFSKQVDIFADLEEDPELNLKIFKEKKSQKLQKQQEQPSKDDLIGAFGLPAGLYSEENEEENKNLEDKEEKRELSPENQHYDHVDKVAPQNTLGKKDQSPKATQKVKKEIKIHKPKTALANSDLTKSKIKITK